MLTSAPTTPVSRPFRRAALTVWGREASLCFGASGNCGVEGVVQQGGRLMLGADKATDVPAPSALVGLLLDPRKAVEAALFQEVAQVMAREVRFACGEGEVAGAPLHEGGEVRRFEVLDGVVLRRGEGAREVERAP